MLKVTDLNIHYGGIQAVRHVSLHVDEGECVALVGANGAGKTSMLKAIARSIEYSSGQIEFCGQNMMDLMPYNVVRAGIALVPEGRGVFPRLGVKDNLLLGAYARQDKSEIASDLQRMWESFPRLFERQEQLAGTLSGGEQQMLVMARALMSRPRLLLLDEPSMGLAPIMVQRIFEVINEISQKGMTILLVEQNARLALATAQRAYVLESGELALSGDSATLLEHPKLRSAYLGEIK